jgi:hypothetical protein
MEIAGIFVNLKSIPCSTLSSAPSTSINRYALGLALLRGLQWLLPEQKIECNYFLPNFLRGLYVQAVVNSRAYSSDLKYL